MALDVSGDWQVFDWVQTVTYYPIVSDGVYGAAKTAMGLKREDHKNYDVASDSIELATHTAIWELWASTQSTTFIPKRSDKFTAAVISGTKTWLVESVDYCDRTSRYRLTCIQEANGS